jgi:hypothetical protein
MNVTLPTHMTLLDWASAVSLDLDSFGAFGRLDDETQWQDWAMQFLNNTTLDRSLPDPYGFTNWREWAERFAQSLS